MKIRTDFVTNSSSSSYIIAYKEDGGFDDETMQKYPCLAVWPELIRSVLEYSDYCDTEEAVVYNSVEEYETKLLEEWGFDRRNQKKRTIKEILSDFEWLCGEYDVIGNYLQKGYTVAQKEVSYHDENLRHEIDILSKNNPNFIVVERD